MKGSRIAEEIMQEYNRKKRWEARLKRIKETNEEKIKREKENGNR